MKMEKAEVITEPVCDVKDFQKRRFTKSRIYNILLRHNIKNK